MTHGSSRKPTYRARQRRSATPTSPARPAFSAKPECLATPTCTAAPEYSATSGCSTTARVCGDTQLQRRPRGRPRSDRPQPRQHARVPSRNAVICHCGSVGKSALFDRVACVANRRRSDKFTSLVHQNSPRKTTVDQKPHDAAPGMAPQNHKSSDHRGTTLKPSLSIVPPWRTSLTT